MDEEIVQAYVKGRDQAPLDMVNTFVWRFAVDGAVFIYPGIDGKEFNRYYNEEAFLEDYEWC